MSRRERILLIVGAVVIVGLVFFYYVYSPRQAEYRKLTEQLADRQNQLDRMEATARLSARLEKEHADLQAFIASVEGKLPTGKEIPTLLVQLEQLTRSLKIDLTSIKPSSLEAATAAAAAPAAGGKAPQPQPPAESAGAYLRFPIKLSITADYNDLLKLLNAFNDFPRLITVKKLTIGPRDIPELTANLDVETFVLPKEAR